MSKLSVQKVSADESRNLPVFAEFNEIADRIRNRAYKLFEDRGFEGAWPGLVVYCVCFVSLLP